MNWVLPFYSRGTVLATEVEWPMGFQVSASILVAAANLQWPHPDPSTSDVGFIFGLSARFSAGNKRPEWEISRCAGNDGVGREMTGVARE